MIEKVMRKTIRDETQNLFQLRATAPGNRSFWNAVNESQGLKRADCLMLDINGVAETDEAILAEYTGNFFSERINNLTDNMSEVEDVEIPSHELIQLTVAEVLEALEHVKTKMSSGPDGVPLKVAKYYGLAKPEVYKDIFNKVLSTKLPDEWKTARVVAIHKKGSKRDVSNYRPVSNLCSMSKILERCILKRLNECASQFLGDHQHGFRPGHSTSTCLMELKDNILDALDAGLHCAVYRLDLSSAFDLLRRDTFAKQFSGLIPPQLLHFMNDFLMDRRYFVNLGATNSRVFLLDRGCPQGSVLGPVLFSLYVGSVPTYLPSSIKYMSYADDTYVVCRGDTLDSVKNQLKTSLEAHVEVLRSLGMIVNAGKTEIVFFDKGKEPYTTQICIGDETIMSKASLKALGVTFDHRLRWDIHVDNVCNRVRGLLCGLRILRRKVTEKQAVCLVTAQVFSVLYYACTVWLTSHLNRTVFKKVESIHLRSLRVAMMDYKQQISRELLTASLQRMDPGTWCRFAACSLAMKVKLSGNPVNLCNSMFANSFTQQRKIGQLFSYDNSKTLLGRGATRNWIGKCIGRVKVPWTTQDLNKDQIRRLLKKVFWSSGTLV